MRERKETEKARKETETSRTGSGKYSKTAIVTPAVIALRQAGWKWREIRQWLAQRPKGVIHISLRQLWKIRIPGEPFRPSPSDSRLVLDARTAVASKSVRGSSIDRHWTWVSQMIERGVSIKEIHAVFRTRWKPEDGPRIPGYERIRGWIHAKREARPDAVANASEGSAHRKHRFNDPMDLYR